LSRFLARNAGAVHGFAGILSSILVVSIIISGFVDNVSVHHCNVLPVAGGNAKRR